MTVPTQDLSGLPPRFQVRRRLGGGADKQVYLADDVALSRQVAVAVIRLEAADASLNELDVVEILGAHPRIAPILETHRSSELLFLISPYFEGGDLASHLRAQPNRRLPLQRCIEVAAQICAGLDHAHRLGVAHGDLTPENILLTEDGKAVLSDFGLARVTFPSDGGAASPGRIWGTPGYLAPEQIAGGPPSARADLYSLGCILFEMATGTAPFVAETTAEVLRMHQAGSSGAPSSLNSAIGPTFDDLIMSLLEREPTNRPACASDVRGALSGIQRTESVLAGAGSAGPFLGREDEIHYLERALRRARDGVPGVVFVSGEPGMGKTRLLTELRANAIKRGGVVLWGEGSLDAGRPHGLFVDALLPLAGRLSRFGSEEQNLLRGFLRIDSEPTTTAATNPERVREETSRAIAAALETFSASRPILLIIDDLHWADSASLDLLEDLTMRIERPRGASAIRLLIVGAHRVVDADQQLGALLARVRTHPGCGLLELSPLQESDIHETLRILGLESPSSQLVHFIMRTTHGNALFVRELIAHLDRHGLLRDVSKLATLSTRTDIDIPKSITTAISARLGEVTPACSEILGIASLLGMAFSVPALAAITARPQLELILDEALRNRLLLAEGDGGYRFPHSLVREVLYASVAGPERERLHLGIARYLRERGELDDVTISGIAHHLLRAGDQVDPGDLVAFTRRSGELALANYAWHEAADLLARAIDEGKRTGVLSRADQAELHRKIGWSYFNRFDAKPCLHHYDAAIEGFREVGDLIGLARSLNDRMRTGVMFGGTSYGAFSDVGPLEEVLDRLGDEQPVLRARIMGTLAETSWAAIQPGRAVELATAAMNLARASGDTELCAELSVRLATGHLQSLHLDDALRAWHDGLEFARGGNNLWATEMCLQRMPLVLFMMGRLDEAEASVREAQKLNVAVRVTGDASLASAVLAGIAVLRGDFETAERSAQESLELVKRARFPWSGAFALATLACMYCLRGNWSAARTWLARLIEPGYLLDDPSSVEPNTRHHLCLIDAYADTLSADSPSELSIPPVDDIGLDFAFLSSLCALVEIARVARSPQLITGIAGALERARNHGAVFCIGWPHLLPRIEGLAASIERRWADAEAHFDRAARIAHAVGARPELARTAIDHADMLLLRDEPEDRSRAAVLLNDAMSDIVAFCPNTLQIHAEKLAAFLNR